MRGMLKSCFCLFCFVLLFLFDWSNSALFESCGNTPRRLFQGQGVCECVWHYFQDVHTAWSLQSQQATLWSLHKLYLWLHKAKGFANTCCCQKQRRSLSEGRCHTRITMSNFFFFYDVCVSVCVCVFSFFFCFALFVCLFVCCRSGWRGGTITNTSSGVYRNCSCIWIGFSSKIRMKRLSLKTKVRSLPFHSQAPNNIDCCDFCSSVRLFVFFFFFRAHVCAHTHPHMWDCAYIYSTKQELSCTTKWCTLHTRQTFVRLCWDVLNVIATMKHKTLPWCVTSYPQVLIWESLSISTAALSCTKMIWKNPLSTKRPITTNDWRSCGKNMTLARLIWKKPKGYSPKKKNASTWVSSLFFSFSFHAHTCTSLFCFLECTPTRLLNQR